MKETSGKWAGMKDRTGRHLPAITEYVYIYSTSKPWHQTFKQSGNIKAVLGRTFCSVKFHITLINLNFYFVPSSAPRAPCQRAQYKLSRLMALLSGAEAFTVVKKGTVVGKEKRKACVGVCLSVTCVCVCARTHRCICEHVHRCTFAYAACKV